MTVRTASLRLRCKLERGNYLAEGNSPAKIIGATPVISAAVGNVTVNGTVGTAITETQVAVDLTNDTFKSNLSGNWITNLPAGLSQSVSYGGTTRAIITISGTPTAASTEQIAITIPEDQLIVNTEDLTVTANADAKFNILAAETYTVSFSANGGTGTMADVTGVSGEYTLPANGFTAPAGKQFKAWSVGGSEKAVGDKIAVTANTTVTAVWEDIPVVTYTVSGTATSFGSNTDNVILQLIAEGYSEADYEVFVKGNTAEYSIEGVAPGTYTMKVMKNNHVTREYTVTVSTENVTQDVEIWLLGDVNGDGKVTTIDFVRVNSHARGVTLLSDYELKCADVVGTDGKVTTADEIRINAHAKGTSLLW